MSRTPTYKGGIKAVIDQYEARRAPLPGAPGQGLPPLDCDLDALARAIVADPSKGPYAPPFADNLHRKIYQLREELQGQSELTVLHGLTVAHLRKRSFPDHAPQLFQRLWAEQGAQLLDQLDSRWLVSAVTTFGDHGTTPIQRSTGLALSTLFGMMKLYENERLYSGKTPDQPFALGNRLKARLPLEMNSYALVGGGLDVNLIARLWQEAQEDAVIAPLAHHLLDLLIHDEAGVFRRLAVMGARKSRRDRAEPPKGNEAPVPARPRKTPDTLRWGLVSTIKAPLPQIARFAAHHLDLGAHVLHLYLDAPDPATAAFLSRHPRIHVTCCDKTYWQTAGRNRMPAHQLRQAFNATRTLRASADMLDWLGHIDHDEFLIADRPIARILSKVAADRAIARIPPAEALAREDGAPRHFKLTHKQAGAKKSTLQEIYPTFGLHLFGGFLSHTGGKVFARPGIPDTRLGIHTLKYKGEDATNRTKPDGLYLAHFHAPSWRHFRDHLDFRREKGSYRPTEARSEMGQGELLTYLEAEEGEAGLRAFFDEVCADTPALRDRLDRHGMLLRHDFDFDATVRRVFGTLP
ncbi:glycosyltransferase family 2 protein [Mameliella alba]|nr:glycosyltransferase family 2 protein [Mameliella alba]MBY6169576.1 glycosyltransferase family 2 protein [Mameliella alba]MBY6174595.1 glycosyltransferase family 2 protein [Mameliella alba]